MVSRELAKYHKGWQLWGGGVVCGHVKSCCDKIGLPKIVVRSRIDSCDSVEARIGGEKTIKNVQERLCFDQG